MPGQARAGFAMWLTGLPSSGKTTLTHALSGLLRERGIAVQILDSDELRRRLTPNPAYSDEERDWFYDTITFLAELLTANGVNVVIAATASRQVYRQRARDRIARFAEVHVVCSPEVCRTRDPKGLWERTDRGEITNLPGSGAAYEAPCAPEAAVDTDRHSPQAAAQRILRRLDRRGFL
jgi:adenylylsulfate kinase